LQMLSGTLMATTIFRHLNGAWIAVWLPVGRPASRHGYHAAVSRNRRGPTAAPPSMRREQRNK